MQISLALAQKKKIEWARCLGLGKPFLARGFRPKGRITVKCFASFIHGSAERRQHAKKRPAIGCAKREKKLFRGRLDDEKLCSAQITSRQRAGNICNDAISSSQRPETLKLDNFSSSNGKEAAVLFPKSSSSRRLARA